MAVSTRCTLALGLALLLSCGGDGPTGPATPAALTLVAGGGQIAPAGTLLPVQIQVRVTSRSGSGMAGIAVSFRVTEGGGFLSAVFGTTDAGGVARASWTLGPRMGEQSVTVTVEGLPPLAVTATALAGPAAQVLGVAGMAQVAVVGRTVQTLPEARVADQFGNPVPGVIVTFRVTGGTGRITDSVQTSNAEGLVRLGGWTLGRTAGNNTVRATIPTGAGVDFLAIGIPAALVRAAGDGQTANAGTLVPIAPAVRALDDEGQPLSGVDVSWIVRSGGGRLVGATITQSGADGIAAASGWILGPAPGPNTLEAVVTGLPIVVFTAAAVPGVPATITAVDAGALAGFAGNFLGALPQARVLDAGGQPVAGATVRFELVGTGGILLGTTPVTDFNGVAAPAVWRLGATPGPQRVRAVVDGIAPIEFTAQATAPPPSQFRIEIRYPDAQPNPAQQAAFDRAVSRWQEAIIGDVPDISLNIPAEGFGCYPAMTETVDDVIIFARLVAIDGPGGVLGQARPCLIRQGTVQTIIGLMQFDTADLTSLENAGQLEAVILHEMAHVLGFFHFIWPAGIATGIGGSDPFFRGITARAAFLHAAGGPGVFAGNIVPLENVGGPGSRDSHWRETVLRTELMTSILNSGAVNPLSAITLSLFRDLGYVVNDAVADSYSLATALQGLAGPGLPMVHGDFRGPVGFVDRQGRIRETLFPFP
jgi:hypothetical protein